MKHVTFTRDMRPYHAGMMRLVPAEVAAKLEEEGAIEPNPPDWPAAPAGADASSDAPRKKPRLPRGRDLLGQTYLTK